MAKRKKPPAPDEEIIQFLNDLDPRPVPFFTVCRLSEADVRRLADGTVPDWLRFTATFWCRDNPKPNDTPAQWDARQHAVNE